MYNNTNYNTLPPFANRQWELLQNNINVPNRLPTNTLKPVTPIRLPNTPTALNYRNGIMNTYGYSPNQVAGTNGMYDNLQLNRNIYNNANTQYQPNVDTSWKPSDTFGALNAGANLLSTGFGIYQGIQQNKLAEKQFEETMKLNRANFTNNARSLNAQYRDQFSGRAYVGMGNDGVNDLALNYRNRRFKENYNDY